MQTRPATCYVDGMMDKLDPSTDRENAEDRPTDLARRLGRYRRRVEYEDRPKSIRLIDHAIAEAGSIPEQPPANIQRTGVKTMTTVRQMLQDAEDVVPRVSAEEAHELISGRDALLVDVRDAHELEQTGKLRGATNVSRGMIEFRADADASQYDPEFRRDRPVILYCASGGRSALAGKALKELGYSEVYNLGGFKGAVEDGFPTEAM